MDISKVYINMCLKAEELQELWQIEDGDFYVRNEKKYIEKEAVCAICDCCNVKDSYGALYIDEYNQRKYIWLLRLDQLILLAESTHASPYGSTNCLQIFQALDDFLYPDDSGNIAINNFNSMEQLFLIFVMKTKFNKVWNGTDWELTKDIKNEN